MSWTQAQLDSLDLAIASGSTVWSHDGRRTEYRSLDEMLRIRALMAADIAGDTTDPRAIQSFYPTSYSKGLE
jgi:hypothetical protein